MSFDLSKKESDFQIRSKQSMKIVKGNAFPLNYPKYADNTTNNDITEGKNTSR